MRKKLLTVALAATMAVASVFSAFAVEAKDAISGDLTVTGFFNEKTDAVELKSGDTLNVKFNCKSESISENYHTYVMAVTGAIGDAYTGATEEVLILRGDSWGWGGGASDIVAPDKDGNKLAFESDVNWDEWQNLLKGGADVNITLSRNANTLTYEAKVGTYTMKTTTTSGKALPDTLYVFLTGENTVLSGISTSKTSASTTPDPTPAPSDDKKDEPTTAAPAGSKDNNVKPSQTGDTTAVAVVAIVALGAAVAVIASKKKVTE